MPEPLPDYQHQHHQLLGLAPVCGNRSLEAKAVPNTARAGEGAGVDAAHFTGAPPREVSLQVLHGRSMPLAISNRQLLLGLDRCRRLDALEWLVQAFDAIRLTDAQLFMAFGLLDRFAATSPEPISAGSRKLL
mmetsp:Transcript_161247/g.517688  ORF Transcript_161247/g.517688 Transcript_161247/m.517688 type:complete len:133 (+) Transcript_161247:64-462(+)